MANKLSDLPEVDPNGICPKAPKPLFIHDWFAQGASFNLPLAAACRNCGVTMGYDPDTYKSHALPPDWPLK